MAKHGWDWDDAAYPEVEAAEGDMRALKILPVTIRILPQGGNCPGCGHRG